MRGAWRLGSAVAHPPVHARRACERDLIGLPAEARHLCVEADLDVQLVGARQEEEGVPVRRKLPATIRPGVGEESRTKLLARCVECAFRHDHD